MDDGQKWTFMENGRGQEWTKVDNRAGGYCSLQPLRPQEGAGIAELNPLAQLAANGVVNRFAAITQAHRPQGVAEVNVLFPIGVLDATSLAADYARNMAKALSRAMAWASSSGMPS